MNKRHFLIICLLLRAGTAFGQWTPTTEPEFAPEFETQHALSRQSLFSTVHSDAYRRFKAHRAEVISKLYQAWPADGEERYRIKPEEKTRFMLRNKAAPESAVEVQFTEDPYVIETKLRGWPTLSQLEALSEVGQKYIFDEQKSFGYVPGSWNSAGHVTMHIAPSFGVDPKTGLTNLVNFITDYINQDFSFGTFGYDPKNAKPYRMGIWRSVGLWGTLRSIRKEIEDGRYQSAVDRLNHFFTKFRGFYFNFRGNEIAVNLQLSSDGLSILPDSKVELRGIRGQSSFEEFVDYARIFRGRIFYLRKNYTDRWVRLSPLPANRGIANFRAFRKYVEESGLEYSRYRYLSRRSHNWCNYALWPQKLLSIILP